MSCDQIGRTTRRGFLGTATAATALTLGTLRLKSSLSAMLDQMQ
jgi:hypothetical protein